MPDPPRSSCLSFSRLLRPVGYNHIILAYCNAVRGGRQPPHLVLAPKISSGSRPRKSISGNTPHLRRSAGGLNTLFSFTSAVVQRETNATRALRVNSHALRLRLEPLCDGSNKRGIGQHFPLAAPDISAVVQEPQRVESAYRIKEKPAELSRLFVGSAYL